VWPLCRELLENPSRGEIFLAMSIALRLGRSEFIEECSNAAASFAHREHEASAAVLRYEALAA
jgi:hypothetical protein